MKTKRKSRAVGRPKGEPNKWAPLHGSRRRIRKEMTGEELPAPALDEPLAHDLLSGAAAIAAFVGKPVAWVYHNRHRLGLKTLGGRTPESAA
jgi:hypothetical protein